MHFIDKKHLEITIGYKLGYDDEIIKQIDITEFDYDTFDTTNPYIILIKKLYKSYPSPSHDSEFVTQRGMITKQYKRDLSLQNLDLQPNQTLWDIGAGSGSCGIEAYKRYKVKTILFENYF